MCVFVADCTLSDTDIRRILDEASRTWLVDEAALLSVSNDLQEIVNCSEEGDIIALEGRGRLQFASRVVLPWRLTVTGGESDAELDDGVLPEARRKQRLECPGDNQGIFLVR